MIERPPLPSISFMEWRGMICDTAENREIQLYLWLSWCEQVAEATRRMLVALEKIGYRLDP